MNRLLGAGFYRLKKDRIFWCCCFVILIGAVAFILNGYRQVNMAEMQQNDHSIDDFYFSMIALICIICSIFSGLFIGTEYSDGTIRNKLIVGHTRESIYLSTYIVSLTASIIFVALYYLGGLIGIPLIGMWKMSMIQLIEYYIISILMIASMTSILTLLEVMISNKAVASVTVIVLTLAFFLASNALFSSLNEPELFSNIQVTNDGTKTEVMVKNPYYISGIARTIYQWIVDVLPTGQAVQMSAVKIINYSRMMLSSVAIIIVTTISGICLFKKKDIK